MSADAVPSDWPTPWELTAPESHVLEFRGGAARDEPFRLAVKELVARRALRIERVEAVRRFRRAKVTHALTDGPLIGRVLEKPLAVVLAVYRRAPKRRLKTLREGSTAPVSIEGLTVADLAAAAGDEFGDTARYRSLHVLPALVQRGLIARTSAKGMKGYDWTAAGRRADCELQDWLALGRQNLSRWAASDVARGVLYAEGAGAALLLMGDLYPELERLGSHVGLVGGGGGVEGGGGGETLDLGFGGTDLNFTGLGDFGGCGGGGCGGGGGGCGGGGGGCGGGGGGS